MVMNVTFINFDFFDPLHSLTASKLWFFYRFFFFIFWVYFTHNFPPNWARKLKFGLWDWLESQKNLLVGSIFSPPNNPENVDFLMSFHTLWICSSHHSPPNWVNKLKFGMLIWYRSRICILGVSTFQSHCISLQLWKFSFSVNFSYSKQPSKVRRSGMVYFLYTNLTCRSSKVLQTAFDGLNYAL